MIEDYFESAGMIGILILCIFIIFFLIIAPLLVAILITNFISVTGIYWWACVFVFWIIIAGIISKLSY